MDNSNSFITLVESFKDKKITVVGDLILDKYVWGVVNKISPEAPVLVVEEKRREARLGGASNVAASLHCLGVNTSLIGVLGDDTEGLEFVSILEKTGIKSDNILVVEDRPTTIKTRVISGSQQVLRIDKEVTSSVADVQYSADEDKIIATLKHSDCIVISDYAKGVVTAKFVSIIEKVSQDHHIPVIIDPHPNNHRLYRKAFLIKPNKKEAENASGIKITSTESAIAAAEALLQRWDCQYLLITLGAEGMLLVGKNKRDTYHFEVQARSVFDVSGAGDCVTAIFAACQSVHSPLPVTGKLANIAAGIVISEVGTVAITKAKLLENMHQFTLK
jgi:rfaE bifunctional protein kinase chain/domain